MRANFGRRNLRSKFVALLKLYFIFCFNFNVENAPTTIAEIIVAYFEKKAELSCGKNFAELSELCWGKILLSWASWATAHFSFFRRLHSSAQLNSPFFQTGWLKNSLYFVNKALFRDFVWFLWKRNHSVLRKIQLLRKSAQQLSFFRQAPSSAQQKFSLAQLSTIFSTAQLSSGESARSED